MSIVRNSWSFIAASSTKRSYTRDEAIAIAEQNDCYEELIFYMREGGYTPTEALAECGLL